MHEIFFNNRLIILKEITVKDNENENETFIHKCNKKLKNILDNFLKNDKLEKIIFEHEDIKKLFNDFKEYFKYIKAAGGLVFNEKEEFLVIERFGIPDLPKGKVKKDENYKKAAIREVEEECGINNLKIIKKLEPTYHIYKEEKTYVLKKTYWFMMQYSDNLQPVPQTEENISSAYFISKKEAVNLAEKTYHSLREMFNSVISCNNH